MHRVPMSRFTIAPLLFALLLFSLLLVVPMTAGATEAKGKKTYIEFVFDSSFSMRDKTPDGRSRMDVAKEVLQEVIGNLEDRPGLEIALRVYGSGRTGNSPCTDSELFQSFGSVNSVRHSILDIVKSLVPRGQTPIGYSLEQAGKDFPKDENSTNIIVLITDGEESCGADPCAISQRLQKEGVILTPYVVGFGLTEAEEAKVMCIGKYYSAKDKNGLVNALQSIMVEVVSPPALEVEARARGANVIERTTVKLFDASGSQVSAGESRIAGGVRRIVLPEGTYTVQGTLPFGDSIVTASQSGVFLKEGETKRVTLDFGDLNGRIRLSATASGKDVTNRIDVQVEQDGKALKTSWSGTPLTTTMMAGTYRIIVTHRDEPSLRKEVTAKVSPYKDTTLDIDLGELPSGLIVDVVFMEKPITPDCTLEITGDGKRLASLPAGQSLFRYKGAPGTVDLKVTHIGEARISKTVSGVVMKGGETSRVLVVLDDVMGLLRIQVQAGDEDITSKAKVRVDGQRGSYEPRFSGKFRELFLPAGVYGFKAWHNGIESSTAEAGVAAGKVTNTLVKLILPGQLIVVPKIKDSLAPLRDVSVQAFQNGKSASEFYPSGSALSASLIPGTYKVVARLLRDPEQIREVDAVTIGDGERKEITVQFAEAGAIRVKATAEGKPVSDVNMEIYEAGKFVRTLPLVSEKDGVFEAGVLAGVYDIKVHPKFGGLEPRWIKNVEVAGGKTVEKEIELVAGKLRVRLEANGKPFTEAYRVQVFEDRELKKYLLDLDETKEPGVWEGIVKAGELTVVITPKTSGLPEVREENLKVEVGSTLEKTINVGNSGILRLAIVMDGRPYRDIYRIHVYRGQGDTNYVADLEEVKPGIWESPLAEGEYTVTIVPSKDGFSNITLENIMIKRGETLEKTVEVGQGGKMRLTFTSKGQPFRGIYRIMVFQDRKKEYYQDYYVMDLEQKGATWEGELEVGEYVLEIITDEPGFENVIIRGFKVGPGQTSERTLELGGTGILCVYLTQDGAPFEGEARVMLYSEYPDKYVADLRHTREPGVYGIKVRSGQYQLEISDGFSEGILEPVDVLTDRTVEKVFEVDFEPYGTWSDYEDEWLEYEAELAGEYEEEYEEEYSDEEYEEEYEEEYSDEEYEEEYEEEEYEEEYDDEESEW